MFKSLANQGFNLVSAAAAAGGVDPFQSIRTAAGSIYDELVLTSWIIGAVVLVIGAFCFMFASESTTQMAKKIMIRVSIGIAVLTCAKPIVTWVASLFGGAAKF